MKEKDPFEIALKKLFKKAKEGLKWAYSSQDMNPANVERKKDTKKPENP